MLSTQMIGNKIAEARKKSNISQAQLAERLFISPQAVGKWERGESMPDIITFNRLAEIFEVDLNYFSDGMPSSTPGEPAINTSGKKVEDLPVEEQKNKRTWDMSRQNLVDIDFSGLKNLHEKFSGSNMQRCLFVGSDISGIHLKGNNIDGCDFSGSNFSKSHIQASNLANNQFKNCSLKDTEFLSSYATNCDFSDADFSGATIKSGGIEKSLITNATWKRTSFISSHLIDLVFEGVIEDCIFENCAFTKVTFQDAILTNTFFKHNSRVKKTQFVNCKADKLTYAFLKTEKADLSGVTLLAE